MQRSRNSRGLKKQPLSPFQLTKKLKALEQAFVGMSQVVAEQQKILQQFFQGVINAKTSSKQDVDQQNPPVSELRSESGRSDEDSVGHEGPPLLRDESGGSDPHSPTITNRSTEKSDGVST